MKINFGKKISGQTGLIALAVVVVAAGAVFWLGVQYGNGSINVSFLNSSSSHNKELPKDLDYASVERLYDVLREKYDGQLSEQTLLDGLKTGLADAAGDQYTKYFNIKDAEELNQELNGSFTGIGAQLGQNEEKQIEVVSPIEGTPAAKAGLRPNDIITTVNSKSTDGWSVDKAVSNIRGPKGSKVVLGIVRDKQALTVTIVRAEITIPSVEHKMLPNNTGYIRITQFSGDTGALAEKAARDLVGKNAKSIVLDLRYNPGGYVPEAIKVASLWLPQDKIIMQEKRGGTVMNTYYANGQPVLNGMPTVVLINGGSASASEIVAGALKDNGAATLLGEKSYGKGSVQEVRQLADGGELKVTVARWYRPSGQNIDKKGITPDKKVTMSAQDYEKGNDLQLQAAEALLK